MPINKNGVYHCKCDSLCNRYPELYDEWYGDSFLGYTFSGLGKDIKETIGDKIRESDSAAVDLWGALANVSWYRYTDDGKGGVSIEEDGFSFRSAGGLISEIQERGCYVNWYCCGITSTVPEWIAEALATKGWTYNAEKWGPPIDYIHCNDGYNPEEA